MLMILTHRISSRISSKFRIRIFYNADPDPGPSQAPFGSGSGIPEPALDPTVGE